jgi:hypothetical protein
VTIFAVNVSEYVGMTSKVTAILAELTQEAIDLSNAGDA